MTRWLSFILLGLLSWNLYASNDPKELELAQAITNAKTPEDKGLAIAQMADYLDNGWQDSEAKMTMILRNQQGEKSKRKVRVRNMEVSGDGDKGLSIFDSPPDVKGTAMLTWSHALQPDDQWIYLPALKRVKRIASKNKSGPFMGSEFAYEDIASEEVAKYTYKYLRDEIHKGLDCYVIERYPAYEYSGYTRQVGWVDKQHFKARKTIFYDRKDALLKTLIYKKYQLYLDKYWRAHTMAMKNHQTGKSTTLLWKDFQFGKGFTDRDFDKNTLKRVR
jgi:hypothetical protein